VTVGEGPTTEDTNMEGRLWYSDSLVTVTDIGIQFNLYYFPFGSKFVRFDTIASLDQKENTQKNGKWRMWGSGDFKTWFPMDPLRHTRASIFFLTLTTQKVRIGFTVEQDIPFLDAVRRLGKGGM
jgi:hypothetical protein